jgi:hypothetical protein
MTKEQSYNQLDFKFAKNWKTFNKWFEQQTQTGRNTKGAPWLDQQRMIITLFEATVPNLVDWKTLWADYAQWIVKIKAKKAEVLWSEQQRQIEALLLGQKNELNQKIFVVAWKNKKGEPEIDSTKSTYWEALRIKKSLEGDANGVGGNEDVDNIVIVNLKRVVR